MGAARALRRANRARVPVLDRARMLARTPEDHALLDVYTGRTTVRDYYGDETFRRKCVHEAGHVAAAVLVGLDYHRVTVAPEPRTMLLSPEVMSLATALEGGTVSAGASVGTVIRCGLSHSDRTRAALLARVRRPGEDDLAVARRLLAEDIGMQTVKLAGPAAELMYIGGRADEELMVSMSGDVNYMPKSAIAAGWQAAQPLVALHWRKILRTAAVLEDRIELDWPTCVRLVHAA